MPFCEHLVHFYDSEDELVDTVAPYLAAGLAADEAVIVIATASHRAACEAELATADLGLQRAVAAGTYLALDAATWLEQLRRCGRLDPAQFDAIIGGAVRSCAARGRGVRVYGEMVTLLWEADDPSAALALEDMWELLRQQSGLKLLCGYRQPRSPAHGEDGASQLLSRICAAPSITHEAGQAIRSALSAGFAPTLGAPGRVRMLLRAALEGLLLTEDVIDDAVLAASELAGNAVQHAGTPFRLLVEPRGSSIWIGVEDDVPLPNGHELVGRSPHGLGLIATLARHWGIITTETGKVVWAEIPRAQPESETRPA